MKIQTITYPTEKQINKSENRSGKCNGCGECCKFMIMRLNNQEEWLDYAKNFGKVVYINGFAELIMPIKCKHLDNNNKCKIYKTRSEPCRQFPHITDTTWHYVKDKCGYKFKSDKQFKMSIE